MDITDDATTKSTSTGTILRNHTLTVRLSDFEHIRLDEQARAAGVSVSQHVRNVMLPDEQQQTVDDRFTELEAFKARLEKMIAEDREVLDRLK